MVGKIAVYLDFREVNPAMHVNNADRAVVDLHREL